MRQLLLALLALAGPQAFAAEPDWIVHYTAKGKFEEVREDLVNAITERGLLLDHNSHVGQMLDRTGKDLGLTRKIFGPDQGQSFSFCSATLSRATMEADPFNIVFCPYTLTLYTTANEPGVVHLIYRRPIRPQSSAASVKTLKDVEELMDGIAREGMGLPKR